MSKIEDYVYLSLCMQAWGVGKRIHAAREAFPHSMGTLFWQFNDVWPAFSWASVDYYGEWKALNYRVRQLYGPVMVGLRPTDYASIASEP